MKKQIFFRQYNADNLTPVVAYHTISALFTQAILCESVEKAEGRGRYSIIACHPDAIWRCLSPEQSDISFYDEAGKQTRSIVSKQPLESLKSLYQETKCDIDPQLPSAASGLFGYFSYDAIRLVEDIPPPPDDILDIPDGFLFRPRIVIIFDSVYDHLFIVTNNLDGQSDMDIIHKRFDMIEKCLENPRHLKFEAITKETLSAQNVKAYQTKESFIQSVEKAKEFIAAGDAFQIVPSQRFSLPFKKDYFEFYRSLRRVNPSPYMFYFNHGDFALAGASPEILVRHNDGTVVIRPIAGTRPRGATPAQDLEYEQDLLNDPKEIAEHLMLLDLGRNDVGRISEIGSVDVTDEYMIERYSHVMHIVSNVTGTLKKEYDFIDAFFSALPAGTVSGAPKVRAMEIINELEVQKRGFYAGGIGYFSSDGNGDFAIMLRTALLKDQEIYFQAGAGVVSDSDPESEYIETLNKAKAIIKAVESC